MRWEWAKGVKIVALVMGLIVALGVVAGIIVLTPHRAYMLQLEMASSGDGMAQLFFDRGKGFSADDCRTLVVRRGEEYLTYDFDLAEARILRVRFDPLAGPGKFRLRGVRVIDDAGKVVRKIAPEQVRPLYQVKPVEVAGDEARVETVEGATDPNLDIHLDSPLDLRRVVMSQRGWAGVGVGVFAGVFLLVMAVGRSAGFMHWLKNAGTGLDRLGALASHADVVALDRWAVIYLLGIALLCGGLGVLGFHGSAVAQMDNYIFEDAAPRGALVGKAKEVRLDEWNIIMPAILYQVRRPDSLAVENSMIGAGGTSLLGNLPTRHFTTLFRPQFWGFFVLPERYAFSMYWQFKNWVLLTGLFLLFKIFVRQTGVSIFGALWFYFSSFTQWWFSTPAAMPEMVGLLGLTVLGACYLLVGRSGWKLMVAGILTAACAVNFALCTYLPFLVPLTWTGLFLLGAFAVARRRQIIDRSGGAVRAAAAGVCVLLIGVMLGGFYISARSAIAGLKDTAYPGRRVEAGGGVSMDLLASDAFAAWAKGPRNMERKAEGDIAFGFYWLAPAALLLAGRLSRRRPVTVMQTAMVAMTALFFLFGVWMTLNVPVSIGKLFYLQTAPAVKCLLALGIVNIVITLLVMAGDGGLNRRPDDGLTFNGVMGELLFIMGTAVVIYAILAEANTALEIVPWKGYLLMAVGLITGMIYCLAQGHRLMLAVLVLGPLIWANGLVNPIDRGFHVFDTSELRQIVKSGKLQDGKWMVFSNRMQAASFFVGNGLDVFNACKFVPDMAALGIVDPARRFTKVYNRAGYLLAMVGPSGKAPEFKTAMFFVNAMALPLEDVTFNKLGIRYVAFDVHSDAGLAPAGMLRPLYDHPVDGFWLYEIMRDGKVRENSLGK